MTSKEREEFKKKLEARKKQRELETNNTKLDNITKDSDESEPINLESLTPYEREEVKTKYKLMTLVFSVMSLILILWILSWVV